MVLKDSCVCVLKILVVVLPFFMYLGVRVYPHETKVLTTSVCR